MNYYQLSNPARRLLFFSFLIFLCSVYSCNENKVDNQTEQEIGDSLSVSRITYIKSRTAVKLNAKALGVLFGNFLDSTKSTCAILLKMESKDLKNLSLAFIDTALINSENFVLYVTEPLEGDPENTELTSVTITGSKQSFLYFNTGDFLMGTGGGEVYHYLIDAAKEQIYPAHFIADKTNGFGLYLPPISRAAEIREFFHTKVSKQYSPLSTLKRDITY